MSLILKPGEPVGEGKEAFTLRNWFRNEEVDGFLPSPPVPVTLGKRPCLCLSVQRSLRGARPLDAVQKPITCLTWVSMSRVNKDTTKCPLGNRGPPFPTPAPPSLINCSDRFYLSPQNCTATRRSRSSSPTGGALKRIFKLKVYHFGAGYGLLPRRGRPSDGLARDLPAGELSARVCGTGDRIGAVHSDQAVEVVVESGRSC